MKIGFFTDTYFPQVNGVTYTIKTWKDKLSEIGEEIFVYYPKSSYKAEKNEFPFHSIEFKFYRGYRVAFPTRISKKAGFLDVVHVHGLFTMAWAGLYISKKFSLPKILTYHTPADQYINYVTRREKLQRLLIRVYNYYEKKLLNSFDLVTAPSNVIKKRLIEKGVNDVIVLSNGIDLKFFRKINPKDFKRKFGIHGKKFIGFCGRFGYEKHLEDLISIAENFDGEILIAGLGPAESYYKKLAKGKKNVKFLGFLNRDDLLGFYSTLDLFIFPSTAETQGLVALEAMACGVPVIGANAFALKDTVKDGKTGYLYEQGDVKTLAELIEKAYEHRKTLSKNCIEYVKEHSIENTIKKLMKIYHKLSI
ncbi:MAG: glycosyltransferase [Candidatus Altiarchaeota archaeon]